MNFEEYMEGLSEQERQQFMRICRRLLKHTFIVSEKDAASRADYLFVSRNPDLFSSYLDYIGYEVMIDRENKVIMLKNRPNVSQSARLQINHLSLRRLDSVILIALWLLYTESLAGSGLSRNKVISMEELNFRLEKYGMINIDRRNMEQALRTLSRYNLISVQGRVGERDCRIRLYPSLQFALDPDAFIALAQDASVRMEGRQDSEEEEEEMDEEE